MNDTAFAVAFEKAGYGDPATELAREAWRKWPGGEAGGARRDFVLSHIKASVAWEIIDRWQPGAWTMAIGKLLNDTRKEIEAERPSNGGGQKEFDSHVAHAPSDSSNAARAAGYRDLGSAAQNGCAVASTHPAETPGSLLASMPPKPIGIAPTAPNLKILADRQAAAMAVKFEVQKHFCRLDTMMIDGEPLRLRTVGYVKQWAKRRDAERRLADTEVRFIRALIGANAEAGRIIGELWPDDEAVNRLYDTAEAEYAA